jgi:haloalkane dehalogenase
MSPREQFVARSQGRIFVRDYPGTGPAFVLMHGFPDDGRIYDDLIPELVQGGRRVVVFDFLGFGRSDKRADIKYSFALQLEDLEAVVDALALTTLVPVGHDASGPAAINFALDHPERVASICLLNSFYGASPHIRIPELIALFATTSLKALSTAMLSDTEQFDWLLRLQQSAFFDALPKSQQTRFLATVVPIMNANLGGDHDSRLAFSQITEQLFPEVRRNTARLRQLGPLTVPATFIWGQHDPYLATGVAQDLLPYFRSPKLESLPAGHWPQLDAPRDVGRLMLRC